MSSSAIISDYELSLGLADALGIYSVISFNSLSANNIEDKLFKRHSQSIDEYTIQSLQDEYEELSEGLHQYYQLLTKAASSTSKKWYAVKFSVLRPANPIDYIDLFDGSAIDNIKKSIVLLEKAANTIIESIPELQSLADSGQVPKRIASTIIEELDSIMGYITMIQSILNEIIDKAKTCI